MPTEFDFTGRRLAPSEIFSDELHSLGGHIISYVALVTSEVKVTQEALMHTMELMCRLQPMLRMRIPVDTRKNKVNIAKRFVEMGEVPIIVEMQKGEDRKSWVKFAEKDLSQAFDASKGPLWKISFIEFEQTTDGLPPLLELDEENEDLADQGMDLSTESEKVTYEGAILFKIHHAIADGISLFEFMQSQLLPVLNDQLSGERTIQNMPHVTLIPPVDDAFMQKSDSKVSGLKRRFSLKRDNKSKKAFVDAAKSKDREPLWKVPIPEGNSSVISSAASSTNDLDLTTRALPFAHPIVATTQIIEASKSNGCTVHATLLAAASLALTAQAYLQKFDIGDEILCGYPVDLRRYRTLSNPQPLGQWLGYNVSKIKNPSKLISPDIFWKEAKILSKSLTSNNDHSKIFSSYSDALKILSKLDDARPYLDLFDVHYELLNLGNCDRKILSDHFQRNSSKRDFPVRMEEHYLMRSMCQASQAPLVLAVSTFRGRLMWSLVYNPRWVTRKFATRYIDQLAAVLRFVTTDENPLEEQQHAHNSNPNPVKEGEQERPVKKRPTRPPRQPPQARKGLESRINNLPAALRAQMAHPNGR